MFFAFFFFAFAGAWVFFGSRGARVEVARERQCNWDAFQNAYYGKAI